MLARTRQLWEQQRGLVGDRLPLFTAVAAACDAGAVLYPGSYVDLTPSFVWPSVVYVDMDRRARQFFADEAGVAELIDEHGAESSDVRFIAGDYAQALGLEDGAFDLLISLYAGFVSEHCSRYLRPDGYLLANPSHGDVAMAALDRRFRLTGAVQSRDGRVDVRTEELDTYLIPKRAAPTVEELHRSGRGVAYTRSAFAYVFRFDG